MTRSAHKHWQSLTIYECLAPCPSGPLPNWTALDLRRASSNGTLHLPSPPLHTQKKKLSVFFVVEPPWGVRSTEKKKGGVGGSDKEKAIAGNDACWSPTSIAWGTIGLRSVRSFDFAVGTFVNATWAVGQSVSLCCPLSRAHHLVPATYSCHNQWNGNSAEARKLLTKSLSKHIGTSMPLSSTNYPSSTLVLTRWKAFVMCNRTEVLGVLTTYPSHLLPESKDNGKPIAVKVDTVVRVAGATCRHGLLFQTYKGFLSGNFVSASEADAEETALRANVGFTRATRYMTMMSPKDMTGLPGAFQVLATYLHGVQTVTKDSQDNVIILGKVSRAVHTPAEVREKLSQRELYVNMPPLSLLELSYKQAQPSEIAAQHSRVTKREPPAVPTDFDPGSGRATRLRDSSLSTAKMYSIGQTTLSKLTSILPGLVAISNTNSFGAMQSMVPLFPAMLCFLLCLDGNSLVPEATRNVEITSANMIRFH